ELLPFTSVVVKLAMRGADLRRAVEGGLAQADRAAGGFLQVSGLRLVWDPRRSAGGRLVSVEVAGKPLAADATYTVAVPSYLFRGGDGFTEFAGARVLVGEESGPGADDLEADGQPRLREAAGDRDRREPDDREAVGEQRPLDVVGHGLPVDLRRVDRLHREGRHGGGRRDDEVVAREEFPDPGPQLGPAPLDTSKVRRRERQAVLDVLYEVLLHDAAPPRELVGVARGHAGAPAHQRDLLRPRQVWMGVGDAAPERSKDAHGAVADGEDLVVDRRHAEVAAPRDAPALESRRADGPDERAWVHLVRDWRAWIGTRDGREHQR